MNMHESLPPFPCCYLQVQVIAKDKGTNQQISEQPAVISVTVDRNRNSPELYSEEATRVTINENTPPGSEIFNFQVRDDDEVVSIHRLILAVVPL